MNDVRHEFSFRSAQRDLTWMPKEIAGNQVRDKATSELQRQLLVMRPSDSNDPLCQLAALFTSATIRASSAAVNSFSANEVGHMRPSSRAALSLKPSVAYLVLNFCASWKKQTTLPSLAYAGIPYHSFAESPGALALMMEWSRSPMARSGADIPAIFATTPLSPPASPVRAPALSS